MISSASGLPGPGRSAPIGFGIVEHATVCFKSGTRLSNRRTGGAALNSSGQEPPWNPRIPCRRLILCVAPNGRAADEERSPAPAPHRPGARQGDGALPGGGSRHGPFACARRRRRQVLDAEAYKSAIAAVRARRARTCWSRSRPKRSAIYAPEAQMDVVRAVRPEAVSIALRGILPDPAREPAVARFLEAEARRGALVQYILYDAADLACFEALLERGIIPRDGASQLFVLGRYSKGADLGSGRPFAVPGRPRERAALEPVRLRRARSRLRARRGGARRPYQGRVREQSAGARRRARARQRRAGRVVARPRA